MSELSNIATGDVSELNDMLVNIGRMIGELDTATTITTGLPVQPLHGVLHAAMAPATHFAMAVRDKLHEKLPRVTAVIISKTLLVHFGPTCKTSTTSTAVCQVGLQTTEVTSTVPKEDDHDIRLDSLEVDTSTFEDSDIAPLIVNIPKRKCSNQGGGHRAKISSVQQLSSDNRSEYSKVPAVNTAESELILKPSTISTRFAARGSTIEPELVVGFNLEEKNEVKAEDETVNNNKKDFQSSVLAEKVSVQIFNEDKSSVRFSINHKLCARDVCYKMMMLNSVKMDPNYVIVEHLTDLGLERSLEDHENVLEVYKTWSPNSNSKFIFRKDPKKYDFFLRTEKYFPPHLLDSESGSDKPVTERAQKAKRILLQNLLSSCSRAPELEGYLHCKEFNKKSWNKTFFILRGSGLYCSTKGKSKASSDLLCYVQFEGSNLYYMVNQRKSFKAPTEFCFAIVPLIAKDLKELKCFCTEDEKTFLSWTLAVRMAKYGIQLRQNHDDMLRKLKKLSNLDSSSRKMQRRMTAESRPLISTTPLPEPEVEPEASVASDGHVAMDFTGQRGKVITNTKEAAAVAGSRPRMKISQRMASNMCVPAQSEISGSKFANQPWFHGRITREESLKLLIKEGLENGMFMVRESCSVAGVYVLTFCMNKKVYHCQLVEDVGPGNKMHIGIAKGPSFPSLLDFIDHYQEKPLNNVSLALRRHCPKHEAHGTS